MDTVSRLLPFTASPYNVHVPTAPAPTGASVSSMSMSHSTGGKGTGAVSTPITVPKVGGVKHPLTSSSGIPSTDVRKKVRMTGMSPSDQMMLWRRVRTVVKKMTRTAIILQSLMVQLAMWLY